MGATTPVSTMPDTWSDTFAPSAPPTKPPNYRLAVLPSVNCGTCSRIDVSAVPTLPPTSAEPSECHPFCRRFNCDVAEDHTCDAWQATEVNADTNVNRGRTLPPYPAPGSPPIERNFEAPGRQQFDLAAREKPATQLGGSEGKRPFDVASLTQIRQDNGQFGPGDGMKLSPDAGGTGGASSKPEKPGKKVYAGPNRTDEIRNASAGGEAVVLRGDELGQSSSEHETRELAESYARKHLQGESWTNAATGRKVGMSRAGIRKIIANTADIRRARLVPAIPLLVERGTAAGPMQKGAPGDKYAEFQRFNAKVNLGGKIENVKFIVGKDRAGHWYYNHDFGEAK